MPPSRQHAPSGWSWINRGQVDLRLWESLHLPLIIIHPDLQPGRTSCLLRFPWLSDNLFSDQWSSYKLIYNLREQWAAIYLSPVWPRFKYWNLKGKIIQQSLLRFNAFETLGALVYCSMTNFERNWKVLKGFFLTAISWYQLISIQYLKNIPWTLKLLFFLSISCSKSPV